MTIQKCLNGRNNNFTLMRFLAALSVLYGHCYPLSLGLNGGEDPISNFLISLWGKSLPSLSVDLFFVTSGFLVCASYIQRQNIVAFIEARILRIFPGLFIAVLFCIFFVGAFVTRDSLSNYFLSTATWSYFKHNTLLITGIQFNLPGVFIDNPYPVSVNGSLWTLPIEIYMYLWLALLGYLLLLQNKKVFNFLFILSCLLLLNLEKNNLEKTHLLLLFMLGSGAYINRSWLTLRFTTLCLLAAFVFLTKEYDFSLIAKSIFFAYFVLLLALHPKLILPSIDRWGDISYGLYIYAFPVQQSIAYLIPNVQPNIMFILSTFITLTLATLSWNFVEKPALKMKGKMRFYLPQLKSI